MNSVVLLDRDGVINQDSYSYIKSVEEFKFLPGSIEAIVRLSQLGYQIGIATNQSGVSRGFYDLATLHAIHEKLLMEVRRAGGTINAIEYCIHMPDAGCFCRKPQPGMLLKLANRFQCASLTGVPFIGDRISDIEAAKKAGATPILVLSTMTDQRLLANYKVPIFNSLAEATNFLVNQNETIFSGV